jgi:hypothetical protein
MAMVGVLFVGVGPAEQVAVVPAASGDFEAKGQATGIEASYYNDGGNAKDIDPAGFAVGTSTDFAVLGHGFVGWRHLGGGVDVAVEVVAVEGFVEDLEGFFARLGDVGGIGGIGFDLGLVLGGESAAVV